MRRLKASIWLAAPVILPLFFGACAFFLPFGSERRRYIYILTVVCLTSLTVIGLNFWGPGEALTLLRFGAMSITFRLDGLGKVFSFMAAGLWPPATVYAFEYMRRSAKKPMFYAFYTMTMGVILAIAYADNYLTMYLFYELLTLVTLPLVIHHMNRPSYDAGKKYIFYSVGGAALGFIGLVFIAVYGASLDFRLGGVFSAAVWAKYGGVLSQAFVLAFAGLGVKAALFPAHGWLPAATVAPTTVTALLHAAAVVKASAFALMRLTYYIFNIDFLWGTWAQWAAMALTLITIFLGSARAWYTGQLKRRLAYSTVGQLSYVLFGVTLMTPEGLAAALLYMVAHGLIKITLFYGCGAIQHMTRRLEVSELAGMGRQMPLTFAAFALAALALMGAPPTIGFMAKLRLLRAAAQSGSPLALLGVLVVGLSILLTAAYMLPILRLAWFPGAEGNVGGAVAAGAGAAGTGTDAVGGGATEAASAGAGTAGGGTGDSRGAGTDAAAAPPGGLTNIMDPPGLMTVPLGILAALTLILGLCGRPLLEWLTRISLGLA
ncbi:MAG: proton-conducting membrane transporter [Peptococcaceae bacterium]|nr:proton-conducting membrane transporter [Peptococcaceae bacterium]